MAKAGGSGTKAAGLARQIGLQPEEVNKVFDAIVSVCNNGGYVQIVGFGTFKKKVVPERQQRMPITGQMVTVPEKVTLTFRPHVKLKMRLGG